MQRAPELKEPVTQTTGSDLHPSKGSVSVRAYRCDSNDASLRQIEAAELKRRVLEKAGYEVREYPQTLPLWAFRLAQHVCRGAYSYGEAWETLEAAALAAGLSESKVARVLYRSFSDAVRFRDVEPTPLSVLRSGVH